MEWENLSLDERVVSMIKQFYDKPSIVQQHSIPQLLKKKDVLVESCTGSGKTDSFLLPCLHFIVQATGDFGIVIIAPTRELTKQIYYILESYCKLLDIECGLVTSGSEPIYPSTKRYILVATPKRLIDAIITKKVNSKIVEVLVLDEADRLVDSTFNIGFSNLLRLFPKQRITAVYSATLCKDEFFMQQFVKKMSMRNPFLVRIKSSLSSTNSSSPAQLKYQLCYSEPHLRILSLLKLLCQNCGERVVIFVNSSDGVAYLMRLLKILSGIDPENPSRQLHLPKKLKSWTVLDKLKEYAFVGIHGKMKSNKRKQMYDQFIKKVENKKQVLISTDLTSRGIDFDQVDTVIQLDPPSDLSVIFHRGGRTARFGKIGKSIILLDPSQTAFEFTMEQKQLQFDLLDLDIDSKLQYLQELNKFDPKLQSLAKASIISLYEGYRNIIYKYIFDLNKISVIDWSIGVGLLHPIYLKETKKTPEQVYTDRLTHLID